MIHRVLKFVLLGIAAATALGFTAHTGVLTIRYLLLSTPCVFNVEKWGIEGTSSEFFVVAEYTYEVKGKSYQGRSKVGPPELNPYSAQAIVNKKPCPTKIAGWCRSWNPSVSAASKKMPWNGVVRSALAWALVGYFFLIRSGTHQDFSQSPKKG